MLEIHGQDWSAKGGGMCPVQMDGMIQGRPFFFWARGRGWEVACSPPFGEPIDVMNGRAPGVRCWGEYGPWPEAGYMRDEDVALMLSMAMRVVRDHIVAGLL